MLAQIHPHTLVVGGSAVGASSVSLPLLFAKPEHSLIRSLAILGMIYTRLAIVALIQLDHNTKTADLNTTVTTLAATVADLAARLAKVEAATVDVARTEHAVLALMRDKTEEDSATWLN